MQMLGQHSATIANALIVLAIAIAMFLTKDATPLLALAFLNHVPPTVAPMSLAHLEPEEDEGREIGFHAQL